MTRRRVHPASTPAAVGAALVLGLAGLVPVAHAAMTDVAADGTVDEQQGEETEVADGAPVPVTEADPADPADTGEVGERQDADLGTEVPGEDDGEPAVDAGPTSSPEDEASGEDGGDGEGRAGRGHGRSTELPAAAAFGQSVARDARDGGVDGQEISARAHARNAERAEQRAAGREAAPPAERSGPGSDGRAADAPGRAVGRAHAPGQQERDTREAGRALGRAHAPGQQDRVADGLPAED